MQEDRERNLDQTNKEKDVVDPPHADEERAAGAENGVQNEETATGEKDAAEAPPGSDETPAGDKQPGDDELARLKQELEKEKAKAEEYYKFLLRVQADFDNFRKRTQKEKEEFRKYASEPLVEALLPVLDNFERALNSPPRDAEKLLEGIEMIYRQLKDILEKEGLKAIMAQGEAFDPTIHEAVMQETTGEYDDNTVIEEMRTGYFFKDKLLRPALVKVARSS